jgi:tetratricopeptide (TPR) repeat protein
MKGLELDEAGELFAQRTGTDSTPRQDIEAAYELTEGHAFWLDLMAVQVARVPGVTLKRLLEDIRRGRGDTPDVLSSIWDTLAERERLVLRVMAETVRPETEEMIEKIVSAELNYQKFKKALKSLISLNLVVVKPENNAPDLYDLHPLVRQFVRRTFERPERVGFIRTVLKQYAIILRGLSSMLGVHLPLVMLERWPQKAELEIEAGLYKDAFQTLFDVRNALIGGGHVEEYVRVTRKLFEAVDWERCASTIPHFDPVLSAFIKSLEALEETADADDLLRRYEGTITQKTARYIKYCEVRCHSFWVRAQYEQAIEWGIRGDDLKKQTNVDTEYDCAHALALARRDGGDPETALKYFLGSSDLDEIASSQVAPTTEGGAKFGNIGRCLQMMGDAERALTCFRKSAAILENDDSLDRLNNQAFAREWIADAFASLNNREMAYIFYTDAEVMLRSTAPARARRIQAAINNLFPNEVPSHITESAAKRRVSNWIDGRIPLLPS